MAMSMTPIQFNEADAEILFSIPRIPADLVTILRCFMFLNRSAPPAFEQLECCLSKAIKVGIVQEEGKKLVVKQEWYNRIHAADDESDNEIESMLTFQESFIGIDFSEVVSSEFALSRVAFQSAVNDLNEEYRRAVEVRNKN